eukprot:TCONS_00065204-protein
MTSFINNTTVRPITSNLTTPSLFYEPPPYPCIWPLFPQYSFTSLTLAILIITLNGFVVYLFFRNKILRLLPGNYILASLAVNDLLNGLFLVSKLYPNFYLHNNDCSNNQQKFLKAEFPTISNTIYLLLMLSSILHLVLLSTDRLIYIIHALTYNSIVTKRKMLKILAITWLLCGIFAALKFLWSLKSGPLNPYRKSIKIYAAITIAVLFIGLPSIILLIQSIIMVLMVRRLDNKSSPDPNKRTGGCKAFVLYMFMYLKFMVFAYPYLIIMLMFQFGAFEPPLIAPSMNAIVICTVIRFVPCLVNPCLYSLQNKDFRKVIKTYLKYCRKTSQSYAMVRKTGASNYLGTLSPQTNLYKMNGDSTEESLVNL